MAGPHNTPEQRAKVIARNWKHGHYGSPEYISWSQAKTRCFNPRVPYYKHYGGRGITMCDRWRHSFLNFLADMGPLPSLHHSLDRFPNKDGNYEPGNCRWATDAQQARNKRNNIWLTHDGETLCVTDWAIRLGVRHTMLTRRLKRGWSVQRTLTTRSRYTG